MGGILLILALIGVGVILFWSIANEENPEGVTTGLLAMRDWTGGEVSDEKERWSLSRRRRSRRLEPMHMRGRKPKQSPR